MNQQQSQRVFIYLDDSNIFISAKNIAGAREGFSARRYVRIHFGNLITLARAGRALDSAFAVGSIPPELRWVWARLEDTGVAVESLERSESSGKEQGVDQTLQLQMLTDALKNNGDPGVVALLTGDGKGFTEDTGFHTCLELMHKKGWGVEVLAWEQSCSRRMKEWVQEHGTFIALEEYYENITFLEASYWEDARGISETPGRPPQPLPEGLPEQRTRSR